MADVNLNISFARKVREGAVPSNPSTPTDTPQNPTQPDFKQTPPVAIAYTTEALMVADQASQELNFLYFDGFQNWIGYEKRALALQGMNLSV